MLDRQVAVVHAAKPGFRVLHVYGPAEPVDDPRQVAIRQGLLGEERVRVGVEQAAVVSRHDVAGTAHVNHVEEALEFAPDVGGLARVFLFAAIFNAVEAAGEFVAETAERTIFRIKSRL